MKKMSKVLIVHTGGFGDLIMARPAVQAVRKRYGDCRIDFLGNPGSLPVLAKDQWITNLIPFPSKSKNFSSSLRVLATLLKLRALRYDLLLLLQPVLSRESHKRLLFLVKLVSARHSIGRRSDFGETFLDTAVPEDPLLHEVERMLSVAECGHSGERTSYEYLLPDTLGKRKSSFHDSERPYAVLGPGGTKRTRRWQIRNFLELARRLSDLEMDVVFIGDRAERELLSGMEDVLPPRTFDLTGRTALEELASIMRGAEIVIANDSGPMHLANALGVPVVGVFGSGDATRTRPYRASSARVVDSGPLACKPCYGRGCDSLKCMEEITVERVWNEVLDLFNEQN